VIFGTLMILPYPFSLTILLNGGFIDLCCQQLLTEMDGFDSDMKVIVMAATNRSKALDAALCRPGRFSRKVLVGVPDLEGHKKILAVHLREIPLEEDPGIISDLVHLRIGWCRSIKYCERGCLTSCTKRSN
jgi:AAA+ superfamily predicted ATPase